MVYKRVRRGLSLMTNSITTLTKGLIKSRNRCKDPHIGACLDVCRSFATQPGHSTRATELTEFVCLLSWGNRHERGLLDAKGGISTSGHL